MRPVVSIILFILVVTLVENISAQNNLFYNPEQPLLTEDLYIDPSTINDKLNYHNGLDLTEDYGHVFIPPTMYKHDGRSRGLLIARCCDSHYSVCEARCPKCFYKYHRKDNIITFKHVLFGECESCHTRCENFVFYGSAQLLPNGDDDKYNKIYYMDIYTVEEVEIEGHTYLKITNNLTKTTKPKDVRPTPTKKFYYPGTEPPSERKMGKISGYMKGYFKTKTSTD